MAHILQNEFERLSWIPISDKINQNVFWLPLSNLWMNWVQMNEVFHWATESNRTLRNNNDNLKHPFRKTTAGQKSHFLGPSKWKTLPEPTKIWTILTLSNNRTILTLSNNRTILTLSASLAKWLSIRLRTKWLWVRVQLQS